LSFYNSSYLDKNNLIDFYNDLTHSKREEVSNNKRETSKIIRVFNQVERSTGIPYFTMKSFLNYPFYDDDIDFIISKNGYQQYVSEIKKLGFQPFFNLADIREPMKKRYKAKGFFIMPHLHSEVSWNGIITCEKEDVLYNSFFKEISGEEIRIPCNTDELLIAIGHFLFENYYFKLGEIIYFKHLLSSDIDFLRIEKISEEFGYRKGVDLFFSYLKAISDSFNLELNIPAKYVYPVKFKINRPFPYYIPYWRLLPVYAENFINGLKRMQIINIFRKLFTYSVVGFLWKYQLPIRRQKKFTRELLFEGN
jgi:hypothetical protein